jgi:hypothetical protein
MVQKMMLTTVIMHHDGAFRLLRDKQSNARAMSAGTVGDAKSVRNPKASQSPLDIFQVPESVIVGNTLPAEVPFGQGR